MISSFGMSKEINAALKAVGKLNAKKPTIGIILGADKNEAVVRYTLGNEENRIFASRYKTYLPTEKELAAEIRREREEIEQEARLK